jgi:cation:H+ antiporter
MATILWALFLGLLLTLGGGVSRVDGAILFAGIILYTLFAIRLGRRERREIQEEYAEHFGSRAGSIRDAALNCGLALGGLVMLVLGADRLVAGAVRLATWFGVSELVIGLTIVAAGTSV